MKMQSQLILQNRGNSATIITDCYVVDMCFRFVQEVQAEINELLSNPNPVDYADPTSANNLLRTGNSNNKKWIGVVLDELIPAIKKWFITIGDDAAGKQLKGSGWKDFDPAGSATQVVPIQHLARFAKIWHQEVRTLTTACL